MMHSLRQFMRTWHIGVILKAYRLDELVNADRLPGPVRWVRWLLPQRKDVSTLPRGERLRLALQELGPVYVKFGQILSTRRDLLPLDIADELALLQDQVPPFPGEQARAIVEAAEPHDVAVIADEVSDTSSLAVLWQCGVKLIAGAFLRESSKVHAQ